MNGLKVGRRGPLPPLACWIGLAILCPGCGHSAPRSDLVLSENWESAEPSQFLVPGEALAAWRGPEGSSLVIYRTLPAPGATAESLAKDLAHRLTNLPELRVESVGFQKIGGRRAARVEAVAPGTGDALAPSGLGKAIAPHGQTLIPTRRINLGFPEPDGPIWFSWHFPESAKETIQPQVEAALATIDL
ncbi:hypothetical protein BH23PLA1_BH23PLA1_19820 [soil metagenome]